MPDKVCERTTAEVCKRCKEDAAPQPLLPLR